MLLYLMTLYEEATSKNLNTKPDDNQLSSRGEFEQERGRETSNHIQKSIHTENHDKESLRHVESVQHP